MNTQNTEYINSTDYKVLETKLKDLKSSMEEIQVRQRASRKLRYAEIDLEAERKAGRILPDELYIPRHLIDNNIKREQAAYVQYITQSPRAVICEDVIDPSVDLAILERDLTKKIRFENWQLSEFANTDCFQANGYGIQELVEDDSTTGNLSYEAVEFADFGFVADCRDIQQLEMTGRWHFFTKTRLEGLKPDPKNPKPDSDWNAEEIDSVLKSEPTNNISIEEYELKDKSLHAVMKVMFRVDGIVQVAWSCPDVCKDWLRKPRPLFIGRRRLTEPQVDPNDQSSMQLAQSFMQVKQQDMGKSDDATLLAMWAIGVIQRGQQPPSEKVYETEYPYFLFPYLISENNTITNLKGRVFLDQDIQEAVSSLTSSTCTQARRASGLYGSKDVSDPNDDVLAQKNFTLRSSCIINSKVAFTQLQAPDPGMFSSIQMLETSNQNETSNVNFAVQNRQDSRKTAKEMKLAEQQTQQLTTVQVVLFSIALRKKYSTMAAIIQSRVLAGLIKVNPQVLPLYARKFTVKPSGDVDVIEKQNMIQTMMTAWPVVQNTAAGPIFLADLLEKMFPDNAAKYVQAMQQAAQQQQQAQQNAQVQEFQQVMGMVKQMAQGIKKLADNPAMFSDQGRLHAFPIVEHYSDMIQQFEQKIEMANKQQRKALINGQQQPGQ